MNLDALSGHAAPSFDDPLGMLHACHRRIEKQLATLDRLQRHLPEHGCDDDARNAARAILRYFDTAGVNHHADEEQSVFPRLVQAAGTEAATLTADLEREHRELAHAWAHMRPLLVGIAAGQRANLSPRDVLALREAYARHIALEEQQLLPLARTSLDADALRIIGEEMAKRRNVDVTGERLAM
ncbi:MAG TPA: hemerythrin domain-containing protein [Casimicrobiaceae bacterium]|nr:hemerythrin domain-containing protein [Casimicrobiaceae bacterium]